MINLYDINTANRFFTLDPVGGLIFWKERPRSDFKCDQSHAAWNTKYGNKVAGGKYKTKSGKTYLQLVHAGKNYGVHRLVYLMAHGRLPDGQIDHVDGDGTNNKPSNLRDVSPSGNSKNCRLHSRNTSGVAGVYWSKQAGKWHARITSEGKTKHIGFFDCIEKARVARRIAEIEMGFSSGHGTKRPL